MHSLLTALILLVFPKAVMAQTVLITANTSWSAITTGAGPGGLPTNSDTISVLNGATLTVDVSNGVCATMTVGTGKNSTSTLSFNSGSQVTVSGDVTVGGNGQRIGALDMTSGGLFKIGGALTGNTLSTFIAGTGTIEYNSAGAQTVPPLAYDNLIFSGSGAKSMSAGTSISGNLSIAPTGSATASIGAGLNLSVGTLTLGGLGRISGIWGSTSSTATFQNNTYFSATTGRITVSTDTLITPTLAVSNSPVTYNGAGQSASVTSSVAGTVSSILTGGTATKINAGTYAVTANFTPTDTTAYTTLTAASAGNFIINKASTSVTIASSLNPSGFKASVNFTSTAPSSATGNIIFTTTIAPFSTNTLSSGRAISLSITNLPRGTNVITVRYAGDANYLGSTNNLLLGQSITNHPPVAASFTVTNDVNTFKKTISALLAYVTDVDGDTISLTGLSTSTNGVTLFTNAVLIQYRNTNNVNDRFSYLVNDGFGGSSTGVVSVIFNPFGNGNPQTGQAGTVIPVAGVAHLTYYGIPTYHYGIQRSTNLATWITIQTTNAPSNGVLNFDDNYSDLGTPPASAYYRLTWTP